MENWRGFLTEASSENQAIPVVKSASVADAAWPLLRPGRAAIAALVKGKGINPRQTPAQQAAAIALGGKENLPSPSQNLQTTEVFAIHDRLGLAELSLGAELTTVVESSTLDCNDPSVASAVLLYFDLGGPVPGHDSYHYTGFPDHASFDKFIKLLASAARSGKDMGKMGIGKRMGTVPCFYPAYDPEQQFTINLEPAQITIGVSPVWNHHKEQTEPSVVIVWGDPSLEGAAGDAAFGSTTPYFLHPDGALAMAREYTRLIAPLVKRNDGEVYQQPSALPYPEALARYCAEKEHEDSKAEPAPATSTGGSEFATVPGIKVGKWGKS